MKIRELDDGSEELEGWEAVEAEPRSGEADESWEKVEGAGRGRSGSGEADPWAREEGGVSRVDGGEVEPCGWEWVWEEVGGSCASGEQDGVIGVSGEPGGVRGADEMPLALPSEREEERGVGGEVVAVPDGHHEAGGEVVKRAFVEVFARALFYPTVMLNYGRSLIETEFNWWDRIDKDIWIGAVPFPSHVPRLKELGITGVVTLTEPFETLVPKCAYELHGMDHLEIPTTDYVYAPSKEKIDKALDFIHKNATEGGSTLVHCKAGRARSATIVLCYLIKYKKMTPEAALARAKSVRTRVKLAAAQWQAVKEFNSSLVDVGEDVSQDVDDDGIDTLQGA
ncbi:phosphatidylglycerophosphate phosphatase PTPMT1-like [Triticum urartu]|nr:phosphatidylglycerophosphate phosphatase PTPMT1-like [Triticum urartu]